MQVHAKSMAFLPTAGSIYTSLLHCGTASLAFTRILALCGLDHIATRLTSQVNPFSSQSTQPKLFYFSNFKWTKASDIFISKIFSLLVACLLILLTVSFADQKFCILKKPYSSSCSFKGCACGVLAKRYLYNPRMQ